ncbi:MAG: Maf family protein, partial [Silvanigrellaceae bacterium]|nr:Maf family protein [Silvanigrellaceae bacterium]
FIWILESFYKYKKEKVKKLAVKMKTPALILASQSPRRKQMLASCGIAFQAIPANILEEQHPGEPVKEYVLRNCTEKALCVAEKLLEKETNIREPFFILSADTIVFSKEGKVLEKPKDQENALQMLSALSNNEHQVMSGYSLFKNREFLTQRIVTTIVTFRKLTLREIHAYISTNEPYDKSGAYGIQEKAMGFVEKIVGSYTNVMGLPLSEVIQDLEKFADIYTFSN